MPASTSTPQPRVPAAAPPAPAADEPLLPRRYDENDLRAAVGVAPLGQTASRDTRSHAGGDRHDDDDESPRRPRRLRRIAVAAISGAAALAIATLALLGTLNRDRYVLTCEAVRAVPQQGRGFPPWGTRPLEGDAWKPLKIAPETRCQPHETQDVLSLERRYLAMTLEQANGLLTADEVTRLDDAEALLQQALLLSRPPAHEPQNLATERAERRKEVEHLRGDVAYWRAAARVRDAAAALTDAAKQFESAAAQQPRHVSDAPTWAAYASKLALQLQAGPTATIPTGPASATPGGPAGALVAPTHGAASEAPASAAADPTAAPAGVALPVEPDTDAGSAAESPPGSSPAAPPPASAPAGGVLL